MKKVLFVFNHPAPYKVRLLNELSKEFDLSVIFERDSNSDRNKKFYEENKINFNRILIKGIKLFRENFLSAGITKIIKNNKFDLIVMNGYSTFAEAHAIRYMKKHNIPYVLYINGGIIRKHESKLRKSYKTKMISGAKAYFSPDKESNKYLVYYGAEEKRILNYTYSTIYEKEIIKSPLTKKEKIAAREKLGLNFENLFVSAGQLIKRKNYLELVKVWKNKQDGLLIFGEGKQRQQIEKFIKKNDLKNVILMGHKSRDEMFKYFAIADAFVFPSNEDIYGHVINEAFSQGLPVISTENVNSAKKLINENLNGFLVKHVNCGCFDVALDKIKKADLTKGAIKTAKENTIEIMVKEHIKMFNEVK